MGNVKKYNVKPINKKLARDYIQRFHYTGTCVSTAGILLSCGLYDKSQLIGVLVFGRSVAETVYESVLGNMYNGKNGTELLRLHVLDGTPKNTESYFIAKSIKLLKNHNPEIDIMVSFADESEGHVGTIYKATNGLYYGKSSDSIFYRDQKNRLKKPRIGGKSITIPDAKRRGWTVEKRAGKHRYLWILKKWIKPKDLSVKFYPYPKLNGDITTTTTHSIEEIKQKQNKLSKFI